MLRGSVIRVTNSNTVSTNPATWAGVVDAMFIAASDPDKPCVGLRIDAFKHPCVIMCAFDVVAIDPEAEAVAVRLHESISFAVFGNGT